jgi:peptidyl-prolyl cis-trans isomerase SurA
LPVEPIFTADADRRLFNVLADERAMRIFSAVFLTMFAAFPALAQEAPAPSPAGEELVDRVVAVVGDTVLLLSDVQAELQQRQASGRPLPDDPAERSRIVEQLIEQRVEQLVLLEAARAAGVEVQDSEIASLVDQDIAAVRERFGGSEAALRSELAASGLTLEQYRGILTSQYRDRAITENFLRSRLGAGARPPVPVTEEEIRNVFETQGASLRSRPANISFRQLVITPQPSDSARAAARRKAEQVLQELQAGGDFAVLARRYSDDPGSKEHGGDLGWFRRGRMVPAFENMVYALRPGQTSPIVETDFGYHIIKLEKARGTERQARHILIRPEITDADRAQARARADSLAAAARAGADFAEIVRRNAKLSEQAPAERTPLDRLPPPYATAFQDAGAGDVVGPFELEGPDGPSWVVAKVSARQEAGAYTLDDVREQIRSRLEEQKMIEQLVAELRKGMYVNVMI